MTRKVLLFCGLLAPLLYVSTDIIAAANYQGYSYTAQTVSETFAIGAPTRPFVVVRGIAFSFLVFAFGLGVRSVREARPLRIAGNLLSTLATVDLAGPFTPMHQRAVLATGGGTLTDTLHIVLASVDVLLIVLVMGFGSTALGKWFRVYSYGTIAVVVLFGCLAGIDGPRVSANQPTPWVGLTERASIYAFMLWMAVTAIVLLRLRAARATKVGTP